MHKIFFYNKFIIRLYKFRALCAHHQEVKIVLYSIWYHVGQNCIIQHLVSSHTVGVMIPDAV